MKKKLLAYYENHYRIIKKRKLYGYDLKCYLLHNDLYYGLCATAMDVFNTNIEYTIWIKKNCKSESVWWYNPPYKATTDNGKINALKFRIDKLKTLIK